MKVDITISDGASIALQGLSTRLADGAQLHARIAGESEKFVKERGRQTAADEHRSASRLGAAPTGHLEKSYQAIESASSPDSASLLVPRASRLRAAFGGYTVRPGAGKKYLTIPVAAEAYGKRAGEIDGLEFMRVGPKKTALLARPESEGRMTTFYLLVKQAEIPEDRGLIPFDDLAAHAADVAELYLLEEGGEA